MGEPWTMCECAPLLPQDREEFRAIQREISFLADCNHPNVVRYLVSNRPTQRAPPIHMQHNAFVCAALPVGQPSEAWCSQHNPAASYG